MAAYLKSSVGDFFFQVESDVKNIVTKTLSSTDEKIEYKAGDFLSGGGLLPGGSIYYGAVIVAEVEYPVAAVGTGDNFVRNNALALTLVDEAGGGTIQVRTGTAPDPVTTTNVCTGERFVIAGGSALTTGGDEYAQVWVNGIEENATTGSGGTAPTVMAAWVPEDEQNVIGYTLIPLLEPVTSQDDLRKLISGYINAFNSLGGSCNIDPEYYLPGYVEGDYT